MEKNEFCEKLANLSEDELMDSAVIDGMKRSLELVLESADSDTRNNDICCVGRNEEIPILELVDIAYARGAIVEVSVFHCMLHWFVAKLQFRSPSFLHLCSC